MISESQHLLDPTAYHSSKKMARAIEQINAMNHKEKESLFREMLQHPHVLELAISSIQKHSPLEVWLIRNISPAEASQFSQSLAAAILPRLSDALCSISSSAPRELPRYVDYVNSAPAVLDILFSNDRDGRDQTQDKRKKSTRLKTALPKMDVKPFRAIGAVVPETPQAAQNLALNIMEELRRVFQFFMTVLRLPEVVEEIRTKAFAEPVTDAPVAEASNISDIVPGSPAPHSAFPQVQPMKAALFFESAEGFGAWHILISTRASRDLREAKRSDTKHFRTIIEKIKELSTGHFTSANQKRLNTASATDIPIYAAKVTYNVRIVYQVDSQLEYGDNEVYRQALRVFGLYTRAQILSNSGFWDSVGRQLSSQYGDEYNQQCIFRRAPTADNITLPQTFGNPGNGKTETSKNVLDLPAAHLDEIHSILTLEKYVTFSQALLNSLWADEEITHVFSISPSEREIVEHKYSCHVIGRSGTGKTTTMLFKIFGMERAWEQSRNGNMDVLVPKPRQMFVTKSRVLADKVQEYYRKLVESHARGDKDIHERARLSKTKKMQGKEELFDKDDEIDWKNDLPLMFSLLTDEHFPLFITFDRLCRLLESDLRQESPHLRFKDLGTDSTEFQTSTAGASGQLITFDLFQNTYWPHFSQALTKGLDPSLVFSEFMGIIKGSEEALQYPGGALDAATYESLSQRAKSTFSTQRSVVYDVFRAYNKRKQECGDYDAADRTHDILKGLHKLGVPGQKIDYLYIDEAQDNLLIDAFLLRSISSNPNGLFWAGDTAQTISVGSSFRFDDLKAFLFRVESQRQEHKSSDKRVQTEPPKTFQLCTNYRAHGGILQCADSIIELITQMWPYAIDKLQPEKGIVHGSKPMFFSNFCKNTAPYQSFLFDERGSHVEFGAGQAILVRDEEAKKKLREEVGVLGLIYTLYESKGLEFDDVLLYNFFAHSVVDAHRWRIVLTGLPVSARSQVPTPKFDEKRHAAVCSELKCLYVAVTRARKNLWILDSSEKSEPMRELWSSREMITEYLPGSQLPQVARKSTPQEWENTGRSLFQHKRYSQALYCFERAEMPQEMAISRAYLLRDEARGTQMRPGKDNTQRFIDAGNAFAQCAEAATEKRGYYRTAAECFANGDCLQRAAELYFDAEEFTLAATFYRKCDMFDEAIEIIKAHRSRMDLTVVDSIVQHARLCYFRAGKLQKAIHCLFESPEKALVYAEDYEFNVARVSMLEAMEKYSEAAELQWSEGRAVVAIKLFLKNQDDPTSLMLGKNRILTALWRILCLGAVPAAAKMNPDLYPLLNMTSKPNVRNLFSSSEADEIAMFHAIIDDNMTELKSLAMKFSQTSNKPAALLCTDHLFSTVNSLQIQNASSLQVIDCLEMFMLYSQLFESVAHQKNPSQSTAAAKLFGFARHSETAIILSRHAYFHEQLSTQHRFEATKDGALIIPDFQFSDIYRRELSCRLLTRMCELERVCRTAMAFNTPCLHYTVTGRCTVSPCMKEHIATRNVSTVWYNERVRIHFQIIIIIEACLSFLGSYEAFRYRRSWLSRLYNTMAPPTHLLGTPANFDKQSIPEFSTGTRVLVEWCRISLIELKAPAVYLTSILQFVGLLDGPRNLNYALRAPCISIKWPPLFIRRETNNEPVYIIHELLDALDGTRNRSHLLQAICFLRYSVHKKLRVDINALCTFIDRLFANIILFARFNAETIWHNVILPQSWFIMFGPKFRQHSVCHINDVQSLVSVAALLLEQISSYPEHLFFKSRPLSEFGYVIRNIFINRICRAMSLVSLNIAPLRSMIHKTLTSFRKLDHEFNPENCGWKELFDAVQRYGWSPLDQLVQLYHSTRPEPTILLKDVRYIAHSSTDVTPCLFASVLSPTAPAIPLASSQSERNATDTDLPGEEANSRYVEPMLPKEVLEQHHVAPASNQEESASMQPGPQPESIDNFSESASELEKIKAAVKVIEKYYRLRQEKKAVRVFENYYRVRLQRLRRAPHPLHRFFRDCLVESERIKWPFGVTYRQLLLGPLPHILTCLLGAREHCDRLKKKAKGRLYEVKDAELEEVGKRINTMTRFIERITKLQTDLDPKAEMHKNRDLARLKTCCIEVEQLLADIPPGYSSEISQNLAIGFKGIVRPRVLSKKKEKPSLRIEPDDLDIYY